MPSQHASETQRIKASFNCIRKQLVFNIPAPNDKIASLSGCQQEQNSKNSGWINDLLLLSSVLSCSILPRPVFVAPTLLSASCSVLNRKKCSQKGIQFFALMLSFLRITYILQEENFKPKEWSSPCRILDSRHVFFTIERPNSLIANSRIYKIPYPSGIILINWWY